METTLIYFSVKAMSATYILYKVWMFIFSPKFYKFWDNQLRYMRMARIRLWKSRKKRMVEKARKARYRARLDKAEAWIAQAENDILKVGHEKKTETQPNPLDEYNEVIGKTKIVYLEDPEVARKTPTRSEPMEKEPIEEDEEIGPDDVIQEEKSLTQEEKEELMAPVDAEPDPDFDTAMTFEDINNVAEVLMSENPDEEKAIRAATTIHHKMHDTVILSFLTDKLSNQEKVNRLVSECLDETGRPLAKRKATSKKVEAFNIDKFV